MTGDLAMQYFIRWYLKDFLDLACCIRWFHFHTFGMKWVKDGWVVRFGWNMEFMQYTSAAYISSLNKGMQKDLNWTEHHVFFFRYFGAMCWEICQLHLSSYVEVSNRLYLSPGPLLLTEIIWTSIRIMACRNNHIYVKQWDIVITHPCTTV